LNSVQDFSDMVPKDEDLVQLDVLRFRPNIIGKPILFSAHHLCCPIHTSFRRSLHLKTDFLTVTGAAAYDEETWARVRLEPSKMSNPEIRNAALLHVSCRTTRCKLPNVDQANGFRHRVEPDRSLRAHRAVDAGAPLKGCLGMQLTPLFENVDGGEGEREAWVGVGMDVVVEERGKHVVLP
jgi:hypothetical protein